MSIIDSLKWRYATKRMNSQTVPSEKIDTLLEAIQLSASGFGLQPYKVFVIDSPELKAQIQPIAYGQPQITEASHVLVFAAWNDITQEKIDAFIQLVAETRNAPLEALTDYKNAIVGSMLNLPKEIQANWADRQVYLAMGTAFAAAAELKIDTTPMEGFVPAKIDELLGLQAQGLHSVLLLTVGYRDESADYMTGAAKVRYPMNELVVKL